MRRRPQQPFWAELPLIAVSVAVVVGFIRVYDSWSFLGQLLAFALGAHLVAITARRTRAPGVVVALLAVGGIAVATGLILFPDTTAFGLPTTATWDAASLALREAKDQYPVVLAPTEALPGFQLAAGIALWMAAWFADCTGHRLQATAEALASTTAIFVFCAVLGSGEYQVACAALFATTVLWFVGVQRAMALEREQAWLPTNRATSRALLRSTAAIAVVAIVAGVVVGPRLPGAGSEAAVSWRNRNAGESSRVTVSPMVELNKRLVNQSDREMFEVRSTERAYWRLTSLDEFDGQIWSSSGEFNEAGEDLPSDAPPGIAGRPITQRITIQALSAIWAPTAFEAVSLRETETPLRWDPDSSTLIVKSSEETSDGLTYSVVSKAPRFTLDDLRIGQAQDPTAIQDRYLGLPSDFPFLASDLAREVTDGADTRYAKARALQDWFRTSFDYSIDVPPGHGDDALVAFLQSGSGYCEQFAGAFAAMARSLGIPSRVAVGFTPGNVDPDDPNVFHVLGRHAHAWPEVYFPGAGWVPFEPTPGRGIPGAENYTGVNEQQDNAQPVVPVTTSTTAVATTVTTTPAQAGATSVPEPTRTRTGDAQTTDTDDDGTSPFTIVGLVALVGLAAGVIAFVRRRRREATRVASLSATDRAWEQATHALARHRSLERDASETHQEFAARAASELDDRTAALLAELADLVTEDRWAPDDGGDAAALRASELADEITASLDQHHAEPQPVG